MNKKEYNELRSLMSSHYLIILCFIIISFGALLNVLVIGFNNGKMPVKTEYNFTSETHFSFNKDSQVIWADLSDKHKIKNIYFSIGDFLMLLGIIVSFIISISLVYKNLKS
jgi:hypothetical protein